MDEDNIRRGGAHHTKKPLSRLYLIICFGAAVGGAVVFLIMWNNEKGSIGTTGALGAVASFVVVFVAFLYAFWNVDRPDDTGTAPPG